MPSLDHPRSAILMISLCADPETGVRDFRVMQTLDPRHPGHVYHVTSREQVIAAVEGWIDAHSDAHGDAPSDAPSDAHGDAAGGGDGQ
ncbi:hypothetical protein [Nonomuraea sp. NPDC050643]|uniref:hypothetical protein n=1 Tax=Nonomuraea sp. NPDC050643 TaxID=3155660 RepID=UPI0033EC4423